MGLSIRPLFAQEKPIKDLLEEKRERKYALYASTLRMVNISQNPDYNDMVSGVEKILIYTLDSATRADRSYMALESVYNNLGFEEYAKALGGEYTMMLLGKESQFVGYFDVGDRVFAFYMRGTIAWQKIPTLIKALRSDDMLNFFDLK